mgnify:CR=1 FL=1
MLKFELLPTLTLDAFICLDIRFINLGKPKVVNKLTELKYEKN